MTFDLDLRKTNHRRDPPWPPPRVGFIVTEAAELILFLVGFEKILKRKQGKAMRRDATRRFDRFVAPPKPAAETEANWEDDDDDSA